MNKDIEQLINYAVKEGFLDDEAYTWPDWAKETYYNECQAYEARQED